MFFNKGAKKIIASANKENEGNNNGQDSKPVVEDESITEYLERKHPKPLQPTRTYEEKELEEEMRKVDHDVAKLVKKKVKEFSFHLKIEFEDVPETHQLEEIIVKSIEDYRMTKKLRQHEEAQAFLMSIKQMKYAKEHLIRVMNMDFNKPTKKLRDMAEKGNIDL